MKKLLFVLFGLTSLNIYAADPATRGALQNNPVLCQYGYNPNCSSSRQYQQNQPTEIVNIKVPSKYMALAMNMKTGMSGGLSIWIPELLRREKPSELVNVVEVMHHVKYLHGQEMVVLPVHREMKAGDQDYSQLQQNQDLPKQKL